MASAGTDIVDEISEFIQIHKAVRALPVLTAFILTVLRDQHE